MTKWIIKDYFAAFKWNNFKSKVANSVYMMIYCTTFLPIIGGYFEKAEYVAVYFLMAIPLIHILNSGMLHIMRMPKLMYMLPLSHSMKRDYIVKSTIFRICFCTLLGIACTVILIALKLCGVITGILIIYNVFTLSLLFCGMNERYAIEEREKWPEVKSDGRGLMQGIDIFVTIISSFGISAMLCSDVNLFPVRANWLFAIPAVFIQLPLTIKYMSYWNKAIEKALSYETSFDK